ncbi:MAG TPA: hypothetical protein VFO79_11560 [Xanthomonadales bacterium]|nr:hypothetical protein [Xanthomonadales bacterium]
MKHAAIPAIFALLLALDASAAIHECSVPGGTPTFTDQPCAGLGKVYKLSSGDIERKRPGRSVIPSVARENERSRFGVGCAARSPQSLVSAVKVALQSGNVNELAGLYDWNGMSRPRAMEQMNRLTKIAQRAPLDVMLESANAGWDYAVVESDGLRAFEGVPPPEPGLPSVRIDQYASGGDDLLDTTRFPITRDSGCVWLSFND